MVRVRARARFRVRARAKNQAKYISLKMLNCRDPIFGWGSGTILHTTQVKPVLR